MILLCSCIIKELSRSQGGAPRPGGQVTSFFWSWGALGKMRPLMGTKGQGGGFLGSDPLYDFYVTDSYLGQGSPQSPKDCPESGILVSETPSPGKPQPGACVVQSALEAEAICQCCLARKKAGSL